MGRVPELFDVMFAGGAGDFIDDGQFAGFGETDDTAVGEAGVGASGVEVVVCGGGLEVVDLDRRGIEPGEGVAGGGLIEAIDADGVVGGRAAKGGAESGVGDVGAGAGIDEYLFAGTGDGEAEGIGMAVAGAERAEGSGIAEDVKIGGGEGGHAGVGEEAGSGRGGRSGGSIEGVWAEPPEGLLEAGFRGTKPGGAAEEYAGGGESAEGEARAFAVGMEEAATVVVAEEGEFAGGREAGVEVTGHALEFGFVGLRDIGIQQGMKEEHVERVDMIVSGLLEVRAVGADLAVHFLDGDGGSAVDPAAAAGSVAEETADGMEDDGFTQKVCIGGEVDGEVVFEVAAVLVEGGEETVTEGGREVGADPVFDPEPGVGAEGDFEGAGPVDAALEGIFG